MRVHATFKISENGIYLKPFFAHMNEEAPLLCFPLIEKLNVPGIFLHCYGSKKA